MGMRKDCALLGVSWYVETAIRPFIYLPTASGIWRRTHARDASISHQASIPGEKTDVLGWMVDGFSSYRITVLPRGFSTGSTATSAVMDSFIPLAREERREAGKGWGGGRTQEEAEAVSSSKQRFLVDFFSLSLSRAFLVLFCFGFGLVQPFFFWFVLC